MKISNNKILAALGITGCALVAASFYWIGRRDELDRIIECGMGHILDGVELSVYGKKNIPITLSVKAWERPAE